MDVNPYESPRYLPEAPPPQPATERTRPAYRLFSRDDVFLATLLGGTAVGAILLAANFGRLGRRADAKLTTAVGLMVHLVVLPVLLLEPNAGWLIAGAALVASAMWCVAYGLQSGAFALHVARGGPREGIGQAILSGLAGMLISSAIVILLRTTIS